MTATGFYSGTNRRSAWSGNRTTKNGWCRRWPGALVCVRPGRGRDWAPALDRGAQSWQSRRARGCAHPCRRGSHRRDPSILPRQLRMRLERLSPRQLRMRLERLSPRQLRTRLDRPGHSRGAKRSDLRSVAHAHAGTAARTPADCPPAQDRTGWVHTSRTAAGQSSSRTCRHVRSPDSPSHGLVLTVECDSTVHARRAE
jgi:hypothetical protein